MFNPTTIMFHMINTALLLAALYYLLYKPVRKFLRAREDKVAGQLDNAAESQKHAAELLERQLQQLGRLVLKHGGQVRHDQAERRAKAASRKFDERRKADRVADADREYAALKAVGKALPKSRHRKPKDG